MSSGLQLEKSASVFTFFLLRLEKNRLNPIMVCFLFDESLGIFLSVLQVHFFVRANVLSEILSTAKGSCHHFSIILKNKKHL